MFPEGGDPIFRDIQPVYEEIGEGLPDAATWPRPGELADHRAEMWKCGLFDNVVVRHFDWEVSYDVDGYLDLLDTFSGHIAMAKWQRNGSTATFVAESPSGPITASDGTSVRSCTLPAAAADLHAFRARRPTTRPTLRSSPRRITGFGVAVQRT